MSKYYKLSEDELKYLLERKNAADYYEKIFKNQPNFEPAQEQLSKYHLHEKNNSLREITKYKIEEIKKLLAENGGNMSEVARKLNISKQAVHQFVKKYSIELPDIVKEKLTEMVNKGLSFSEIRIATGINAVILREKLKEYSLITSDMLEKLEEKEKIISMVNEGLTVSEIQKITGLPLYTIYRKLKNYSIETKSSSKRNNIKKLIIELAEKGLSGSEIAKQIGVPLYTIYYYSMRFKLNLTKNRKYNEKQ